MSIPILTQTNSQTKPIGFAFEVAEQGLADELLEECNSLVSSSIIAPNKIFKRVGLASISLEYTNDGIRTSFQGGQLQIETLRGYRLKSFFLGLPHPVYSPIIINVADHQLWGNTVYTLHPKALSRIYAFVNQVKDLTQLYSKSET